MVMKFKTFEEMPVWQDARSLTSLIYTITESGRFARDFGLKDQIRRSAVSIMSNISEGYERSSKKEFAMFLGYAKGSAGELRSQLYVALDQKYISQDQFNDAHRRASEISSQLSKFSTYLRAVRTTRLTGTVISVLTLFSI
jgi:four helix bundle protein